MTKEPIRKLSMVREEKELLNGSGTTIQDVNRLLKQFEDMNKMMKNFTRGGKTRMLKNFQMPQGMGF
jgi:signal recognition particle subunit SRP54